MCLFIQRYNTCLHGDTRTIACRNRTDSWNDRLVDDRTYVYRSIMHAYHYMRNDGGIKWKLNRVL